MTYEETNAAGVGAPVQVIVALFDDAKDAHLAVTQLREGGFSSSQIGAAFLDGSTGRYADRSAAASTSTGQIEHDGESWWEKVKDAFRSDDSKMETGREAVADSDLDIDPYTRDEHEYDFAGDEFAGSLSGIGIPSDRATYLTSNLRNGGAIVTVRDADRGGEAEKILAANGGRIRYEDAAAPNAAGTNYRATDGVVPAGATIDAADSTGREVTDTGYVDRPAGDTPELNRVQLFGEVLRVHKERITRGEVRVRKEVVTENQSVEVPVTREELVLERVAVPADTAAPAGSIGRDQEIRVPLSEETVRVEKVPVVREEVRVGKRDVADVTKVEDVVRHEELRVDSDVDSARRTVAGEEVADDLRRRG